MRTIAYLLRSPSRVRARSHAFTLLEVLLVLAILVVMATLGTLSLRGSQRHQRLLRGAEQLQTEWARARGKAIKSGHVQVFRYTLQGRQYVIHPETSLDDATPAELLMTATGTPTGTPMMNGDTATAIAPWTSENGTSSSIRTRQLPFGVQFLGGNVQIDPRSALQMTAAGTQTDMQQAFAWNGPLNNPQNGEPSSANDDSDATSLDWGMPIYFFPDGTTSTVTMTLSNDQQQAVTVTLRGLTGVSHTGRVVDAASSAALGK